MHNIKVKGHSEWARKGTTQGALDNTSDGAYREAMQARKYHMDLKKQIELLKNLTGGQNVQ